MGGGINLCGYARTRGTAIGGGDYQGGVLIENEDWPGQEILARRPEQLGGFVGAGHEVSAEKEKYGDAFVSTRTTAEAVLMEVPVKGAEVAGGKGREKENPVKRNDLPQGRNEERDQKKRSLSWPGAIWRSGGNRGVGRRGLLAGGV